MHFVNGLPKMPLSELDFHHHGNRYCVTGMVQYISGTSAPNHFVAWLKNTQGKSEKHKNIFFSKCLLPLSVLRVFVLFCVLVLVRAILSWYP